MTDDSVRAIRVFYEALGRGDAAAALGQLADPLRWTEAEGFPYYSGDWRSPAEVRDKLLVALQRDWDAFSATPHEFFVSGDRVVALGVYEGVAKATGRRLRAPFAHAWTVRDGKVATFDMYTDTHLVRRALA
jgi:ketosteroid isomerase-like protein